MRWWLNIPIGECGAEVGMGMTNAMWIDLIGINVISGLMDEVG